MARGKDDVWNYGISGFFNGGWIGAGLGEQEELSTVCCQRFYLPLLWNAQEA
jgi:hypothetical protein